MLIDLSLYTSYYEPKFLESSANYYLEQTSNRMADVLSQNTGQATAQYLQYARMRIESEEMQCNDGYLDESTQKPLVSLMETILLNEQSSQLLDCGFVDLLKGSDFVNLKLFYNLFKRVACIEPLKEKFSEYVVVFLLLIVGDRINICRRSE